MKLCDAFGLVSSYNVCIPSEALFKKKQLNLYLNSKVKHEKFREAASISKIRS